MDEEKQSEAGGQEPERVGPYRLEAQVSHSRDGREGLYLATNETSGARALVLKTAFLEGVGAVKQWRVRFIFSASEGYKALEAEETPYAVAADRQSAESLMSTLEAVARAVRHMDKALPVFDRPRPRWRLGQVLASTIAVCTLLFALLHLTSESPPPSGSEPLADHPPLLTGDDSQASAGTPDDPFASGALVDTLDAGDSVIARPLPREPFKGQKRPPCNRHAEVELIGACWTPHELKAPCPDVLYEHQGKCYVPNFSAKPPPQSLGQ